MTRTRKPRKKPTPSTAEVLWGEVKGPVANTSQGADLAAVCRSLERQRDDALHRLSRRANANKSLEVLDTTLARVETAVDRLQRVERLVTSILDAVRTFEEAE